jgi:hypothetical protein
MQQVRKCGAAPDAVQPQGGFTVLTSMSQSRCECCCAMFVPEFLVDETLQEHNQTCAVQDRLHGGSLRWWVWVEDPVLNRLHHAEAWTLTKKVRSTCFKSYSLHILRLKCIAFTSLWST